MKDWDKINSRANHYYNEIIGGTKLFGDNFTSEEIKEWYSVESSSYEKIIDKDNYIYHYHSLNKILGFSKLPNNIRLVNVLSFGGGFGYEIEPIVDRVDNIFIVEPSHMFRQNNIKGKKIKYIRPSVMGKLNFPNDFFDVITCFGVLMYIPNVSFVLSELYRCLKPGGYLLIREPITDMRILENIDRKGCGYNTRGIPLIFFKEWLKRTHFSNKKITLHGLGPFLKILKNLGIDVYNSDILTSIDIFISRLFTFNYVYHRNNPLKKVSPGSAFLMLKK